MLVRNADRADADARRRSSRGVGEADRPAHHRPPVDLRYTSHEPGQDHAPLGSPAGRWGEGPHPVLREDGRADPRRPGAALATALRRAQRLADDPAGAVWYAARRIFAFALMLMIRDGIPVSEVESAGPDELALVRHQAGTGGRHGCPGSRSSTRYSARSTRLRSPATGTSRIQAPGTSPASKSGGRSWISTRSTGWGKTILEYWIPAEDLPALNAASSA